MSPVLILLHNEIDPPRHAPDSSKGQFMSESTASLRPQKAPFTRHLLFKRLNRLECLPSMLVFACLFSRLLYTFSFHSRKNTGPTSPDHIGHYTVPAETINCNIDCNELTLVQHFFLVGARAIML